MRSSPSLATSDALATSHDSSWESRLSRSDRHCLHRTRFVQSLSTSRKGDRFRLDSSCCNRKGGYHASRPCADVITELQNTLRAGLRCSIGADMSRVAYNPVIAPDRKVDEEKKPGESEPPRIRCPLRNWSPRQQDKWFCNCSFEWNTFDTGGVCLHQWNETQCLSSGRWSLHSLWYTQ